MKIKSIAPIAAVTLLTTSAASAAPNIEEVSKYSVDQVTSINQFTDVRPSDWAYQALMNLTETYGCVAGYPNGTYGGSKAMTRFEAAALLNACLDRVVEITDELKKLQDEFSAELALLRGRVGKVEFRVGELEANQFSTTTKLRGEANFILGGVPDLRTNSGVDVGNTTFNYDLRLMLDTSFTGKDLLHTRLRSGNFSQYPFGASSSLFKLDKAQVSEGDVSLDRLYYTFPALTKGLNLTAGPLLRNTEMVWMPSAYKSEILEFFTTAGAPGVYNRATGAGVGAQYNNGGLVLGMNYVSQEADDSTTGVFDEAGGINFLSQVGYRGDNWGIAAGYRYGTEGTRPRSYNGFYGANGSLVEGQDSNSVSINAYWQPSSSGILPSVSAGYGYNWVNGQPGSTDATDSDSWFAGLQWSDVFRRGNSAGVAVGQAPSSETVDKSTILELFYKFRVSDNVSITPALFYVDNNQRYEDSNRWGGVVQTKFTF